MSGEPTSVDPAFIVVHRDERVLVLDKAPGFLSVPGIGPEKVDCIALRAARAFPGARIVHRLDRDTSGLMVMALDPQTHRYLSGQFEHRQVRKRYTAIVAGALEQDRGTVDLPIAKDFSNPPRQRIDHEHGRPSITDWEVAQRIAQGPCTRVHLHPRTGRSHQLRLHMMTLGHPILGDDLYATAEVRAMSARLLLHSDQLAFTDPLSRETVSFESPAPF